VCITQYVMARIRKIGKFLKWVLPKNVVGITLAPFGIYVNMDRKHRNLLNTIEHEKIHWKQQWEMLIIIWYIWYLVEYLIRRIIRRKGRYDAYKNIVFEKEAYDWVNIKKRKPYNWIKYL